MQTRVVRIVPDERHGYLRNPNGGKDIYFGFDGNRRTNGGKILPGKHDDASLIHILSTPNRPVKVLTLEEGSDPPQATQWKLI